MTQVPESSISVRPGPTFVLSGQTTSYHFHVDQESGDLQHDHFGGISPSIPPGPIDNTEGWTGKLSRAHRDFPDFGRGDFRSPAIRLRHRDGNTTSRFRYESHDVQRGKPPLSGLPSSFGSTDNVRTLTVHLKDDFQGLSVDLLYSIFPSSDFVTRSFRIHNNGTESVVLEDACSWSMDMSNETLDLIALHGDWGYEMNKTRRPVSNGKMGFASSAGFSSAHYSPCFALASPSTTEDYGDAYGFALIYSGSFSVNIEKAAHGSTRVQMGLNPLHLSWPIAPGEAFTSPEAIATYSANGLGGMSRAFHRFFRQHIIRSPMVMVDRPVLLNHWEGLEFDISADALLPMARQTAEMGLKLFVMDDGWFGGKEHPRDHDAAGLGDWQVNPKRFPNGLKAFVDEVTSITVTGNSEKLRFGIWIEPEMVNPDSQLYATHPEWVMQASGRSHTTIRNQLILNLGLPEVQDFIIDFVSSLLANHPITYVKWDHNRGIHELPTPSSSHAYLLGLYRVVDTLTNRFQDVLWEGCGSGGSRFDPGMAHYWPQFWASDNSDGRDRLMIQYGASLFYPPSSMSGHLSVVPNAQTGRVTPFMFRAHVAIMCGSFGLELDPKHLTEDERDQLSSFIPLAERINNIIIGGDFYRLGWIDETNWPAGQYISQDGKSCLVFAFQISYAVRPTPPRIKLKGLDKSAIYKVHDDELSFEASGAALMNVGFGVPWTMGDYQSRLLFLDKV